MFRNALDFLDYYFTKWVYIRRSVTDECGLHYEGTIFGVPAWFTSEDKYTATGVPKFVPFRFYTLAADKFMDWVSYVMPKGWRMDMPITIHEKRK